MRQVDRLVLKEIVGPWVFGVGLFSSLLMAGTYLNRVADFVVGGAPIGTIAEFVLLLIPAILVKTFTMAVLLAALLSFGRLSSDSEIVAMRAGGASVTRIVAPVMAFSLAIAVFTFFFNEAIVPPAASRAKQLLVELANRRGKRDGEPVAFYLAKQGKLTAYVVAKSLNPATRTMAGVTVVAYGKEGEVNYYLSAPEMEYRGEDDWHIRGKSRLLKADGTYLAEPDEVWPEQIARFNKSPLDILRASDNDPDLLSMREVGEAIAKGRRDGDVPQARLKNMQYWYWNKVSVPLAAFVFGTLGAVLGIRNHRTGTASGFALAVAIIFGYVTLANFMNVWAQGGVLPAYVASFLPLVLGLIASGIMIWKRNV